ncbi:MAG: DNA cytosine methyltransferase [Janthinobacterium lividum]
MIFQCADLFCGSGGTSTGLMQAAEEMGLTVNLVAVNHWQTAINTHTANHPGVTHYCEDLETVNPRHAVPGGHLHLLVASPECTHHSNARGGRPMSDQSRASAWHVLRWADALYIENILIENVKEFRDWGPLTAEGRPDPKMKGRLYRQFLAGLRALGYKVEEKVLNAADYGDATTRQRLFIQARRGTKRPAWPVASHQKPGEDPMGLLTEYPKWKPAREIIDWSLPSNSIYTRKRPLADATMARIFAGLRKYSDLPFIVPNLSEREGQAPRTHDIDAPLPTVTTFGGGNLVEPFLIGAGGPVGAGQPQAVSDPLGTVLGVNHRALVQPYLVILRANADGKSLDEPVPALTTGGNMALAEPFIIRYYSERPNQEKYTGSMSEPLHTITGRGAGALIETSLEPFITNMEHSSEGHARRCYDMERPVPTITGKGMFGLCEPFLSKFHGSHTGKSDGDKRNLPLDAPLPTLDTSNRVGLVEPFLVSYYGQGGPASVDEPLDTVTSRDRFTLVDPRLVTEGMLDKGEVVGWLDIRFRMLQPKELARAMSFPEDYKFTGNREAQVKQIGNSVAVKTAKALCMTILGGKQ